MPIFDYKCPNGHTSEELRRVNERNDPISCPECWENMELQVGAPHFAVLKMGTSRDFPTFWSKWGKIQRAKNSGKIKDEANKDASDKTMHQAGLL